MNYEASESVRRCNYLLGIDRCNQHGSVDAKSMPYPYLLCKEAKTSYFSGINDARDKRPYQW